MSETLALTEYPDGTGHDLIRLKGYLDDCWANWFDGLTITLEDNGDTLLIVALVDQVALHMLKRVRDLVMPLLSVNFVSPDQARPQKVEQ